MTVRRLLASATAVLAVLLLWAAPADAQRRQNCELVYAGTTNSFGINTPSQVDFLGGGVTLRCDGGTTIRSDSAVNTSINNRLEFIGRVRYADTLRTLRSDYLQYLGQQRLIIANNNVVLTDLRNGSRLEGPFLSYYLATETRPEEILQMPQGRPRATLVRASAQDSARSDTTIVDANTIEIIGENRFTGRGNVEIKRGDVEASGGQVVFQEQSNVLTLTQGARVETEQYTMLGDTIIARGDDAGGDFSEIDSRLGAQLRSEDLDVTGLGIRVFLADGQVDRLSAVGDTARVTRATALSPDFRLEADSIEAVAPAQVLETVRAFGGALGVRVTPDSLIAPDTPEMIRDDWVRGDTIIALFTDAPPPETPADTAAPERVLERLDAMGGASGLASSLYKMLEEDAEAGSYAVNYMVARHITVLLAAGEVTTVEAEDEVHGVYLRPPGAARGPGGTAATPPGTGGR